MAPLDPVFEIAAAHNITPRTAATWSPQIPRAPRVMVPVQLDALVVRQAGGSWANCLMSAPPDPPPGSPPDTVVPRLSLLPPPFQELATSRPTGVYLHWALPDGLTRATIPGPTDPGTTPDPTTPAQFPQIPDRWLVVRMFPSRRVATRRAIQGWVLRTGEKVPVVVPLDQWTEPGTIKDTKQPLTAAGHGDPAWAAYYDNVVNRLGFYDDLKGISSGPLAYLVCGWYSDPAADPLGTTLHSLNEFDQRMVELGWELVTGELDESFVQHVKASTMVGLPTREAFTIQAPQSLGLSERLATTAQIAPLVDGAGSPPTPLDASGHPQGGSYTTNGAWWPTLTVYHGCAVGIGWPGIGIPGSENGLLQGEVGGPPPASSIRVVFANTLAEALGETIALTNNTPEEGRALEAFMLGALSEFEQPDGAARVDARLHANTFGSISGGEVTETITLPDRSGTPPLPSQPVQSAPGVFQTAATSGGTRFARAVKGGPVIVEAARASSQAAHVQFPNERLSEISILNGRLAEVVGALPSKIVQPAPQQPVQVKRSLPRFFFPADPVFLLQGGGRSFKHGADGNFSEDGRLSCRLTGFAVTELACSGITGGPIERPFISGDDLLERSIENGSVPRECEDLLTEAVLLDPGVSVSAAELSTGLQGAQLGAQAGNFAVEQTVWWATRDPRTDSGPLIAKSGYAGTLPSPVGVTPPWRPWNPLHCDWEIQFIPSPHGSDDWELDETDYLPDTNNLPAVGDTKSGFILQGRALLTGGAAATIAASVRNTLKQASQAGGAASLPPQGNIRFASGTSQVLLTRLANVNLPSTPPPGPVDRSTLEDIANALENMDVLVGALDNFHTRLRGKISGDGTSTPAPGSPLPIPFLPMRSGFLRLRRLRLIDCFGQFVDLAGSNDTTLADPNQWIKSEPVHIPSREDLAAMPTRFTSPARLWFRFRDASGKDQDATDAISPVAGYVLPNHLDGALEFFDVSGTNLGIVRPDPAAGVVWEEAPGQPSTLGKSPARAITNPYLGGVAQGLVEWGVADATPGALQDEDALSALLRIVDSTLWSIDPFGHVGDEHMSLLVGHPIAVLRAQLRLEVKEPVTPDIVNQTRIPVRIGALVHWQDGLMGYFVNDDYRTLYCADAAVAGFAREVGPGRGFLQQINLVPDYYQQFSNDLGATVTKGKTPVTHPYVNDSGVFFIQPNQDVNLTLLVEPHSLVHATCGLTPRKEIGIRRNWVADALAKLSPTFRFGPLLVDPKRIRMPVSGDIQGAWSWDHRTAVTAWTEDSVVNSTGDAAIPPDPAKGQEGWLRVVPKPQG